MKRIFLLVLGCALATGIAGAQNRTARIEAFERGDVVLNLGVGLGNTVYGNGYTNKFPPLSLSGEYAMTSGLFNNGRGGIGMGAYVGYTSAKYRAFNDLDAGWRYHNLILGVRGALHYQFVSRLDTYLGLFLGYNISMTSEYGKFATKPSAPSNGGFEFAFYVGARYYMTRRLAIFAEVGYGLATVNLGFAYKF